MRDWFRTAWLPSVRRRALRVALLVGTLLVLINHVDRILAADLDGVWALKVVLTYTVPYAVSTYASVGAIRDGEAGV
jgi:hypothetical protein